MKGILFKPDMHKAIREGRKTVTRRLITPPVGPEVDLQEMCATIEPQHWQTFGHSWKWWDACASNPEYIWKPRYLPGETVYVKEAWKLMRWIENPLLGDAIRPNVFEGFRIDIGYSDSTTKGFYETEWPEGWDKAHRLRNGDGGWQSPLFLPERFTRTFLTIKDVRPERLQEITEADCIAEGIEFRVGHINVRLKYENLWDSINKPPHDWAADPWVWRIEFEVQP